MQTKTCTLCGQSKVLTDFYQRKSGNRIGEYYEKCKLCMKDRGKRYYSANHERQLKLALLRRHKAYKLKRDWINAAKNRPCADCRVKYPYYVMDFDHQDPIDKINDVAYMVRRNWSLEKIKQEVLKCQVVCANCHRKRTYKNLPS